MEEQMRLKPILVASLMILGTASGVDSASAADSADVEVLLNAQQVAEKRIDAARARAAGREAGAVQRARVDHIRDSAKRGATYATDEVEAFELSDGIVLALPKNATVRSVRLKKGDQRVVADADVVAEDTAVPGHQGLGMASWSTGTSGCYTITIVGAARMQTCWYKKKMLDDGDGLNSYYSYQRKAWGQADDIWGQDWSITGMKVRSFPTSGTAGNFRGVMSRKPSVDFTGDCNTLPFSLSLSYKGASTGLTFTDCNYYDVTFGTRYGDYSNYFYQGSIFSRGNREVAYHEITKAAQGTLTAWNDYQRLEIARWTYPAKSCSSVNSGASCNP